VTYCLCPRSCYDPRTKRPTNPDCPRHGEEKEEDKQ
jgi:hypothetical protein